MSSHRSDPPGRPDRLPLREAAGFFALLCLLRLFLYNVTANELTKFSDAMFYVSPDWVRDFLPAGPEPGRRQWLFQVLLAPLLTGPGFLAASIAGRMAGYLALAWGLARVTQALGLRLLFAAPVVVLLDRFPSLAAGEWLTLGVEPKVFSYALVLLALADLLRGARSPAKLALLLGLATSFHVLVGLYATLAVAPLALLEGRRNGAGWQATVRPALVFAAAGLAGLRPVAVHLLGWDAPAGPAGGPAASYIYVFLRVPHHLLPASWPALWWLKPLGCALLLGLAYGLLRRHARRGDAAAELFAPRVLLRFTGLSMAPFLFGLAAAPFDADGRILQYYLFRFGDVMLPLATNLLAALALQKVPGEPWAGRIASVLRVAVTAGAAALCLVSAAALSRLSDFPGPAQNVTPQWRQCTDWARRNTPAEALFITPPLGAENFPWLAQRRSLGTFKQVNMSGGLREWHRKMSDLAGTDQPWPAGGWAAAAWLSDRYGRLSTAQVLALMRAYGASFFITGPEHRLGLAVAYANARHVVYAPALAAPPGYP